MDVTEFLTVEINTCLTQLETDCLRFVALTACKICLLLFVVVNNLSQLTCPSCQSQYGIFVLM